MIMNQLYGYYIVATDFFRRHYLVYDAAYTKVGSLDLRKGVWTFTLANTGETWFGYSRDHAFRAFLLDPGQVMPPPISAPRPFPALKTAL